MIQKISHLPSRTIQLDGIEHLFFSGTSYLGMGHQVQFREALAEGFSQYGTVFSASRNNNLQLNIYDEAEAFLADWTGAKAALTVTSGLLAGQLTVAALPKDATILYAPSVHPAIWGEKTPQYLGENFEDFTKNIAQKVTECTGEVVIACNALDPLRCVPYDFDWLMQLPDNQSITVVVDDSHGIGVTGTEGGGFLRKISFLPKSNIRLIVIASLAKAVGIPGGVILGDAAFIQSVRSNPLFVGASPIVPAYLFAFLKCQDLYTDLRRLLLENVLFFKEKYAQNAPTTEGGYLELKIKNSQLKAANGETFELRMFDDYPVFSTDYPDLYANLLEKRIFISHFSYPKPTDPPLTRLVLSSLHTREDIECLVTAL
jgi:8-amino-7-oxononanoate synthase